MRELRPAFTTSLLPILTPLLIASVEATASLLVGVSRNSTARGSSFWPDLILCF